MTYTIRKQDTATRTYGVFWGDTLVAGGYADRSDAEDMQEVFQRKHPTGPENIREVNGWWH